MNREEFSELKHNNTFIFLGIIFSIENVFSLWSILNLQNANRSNWWEASFKCFFEVLYTENPCKICMCIYIFFILCTVNAEVHMFLAWTGPRCLFSYLIIFVFLCVIFLKVKKKKKKRTHDIYWRNTHSLNSRLHVKQINLVSSFALVLYAKHRWCEFN